MRALFFTFCLAIMASLVSCGLEPVNVTSEGVILQDVFSGDRCSEFLNQDEASYYLQELGSLNEFVLESEDMGELLRGIYPGNVVTVEGVLQFGIIEVESIRLFDNEYQGNDALDHDGK